MVMVKKLVIMNEGLQIIRKLKELKPHPDIRELHSMVKILLVEQLGMNRWDY